MIGGQCGLWRGACFFFSSRRRHTRSLCDWSSDVCSSDLVYEGNGIAGVITEDKGVDKNGNPKDNFTPGYELRAKVTVLAEGTRGSLTKKLVAAKKLDNINPQTYGIGIKELWAVQPGRRSEERR